MAHGPGSLVGIAELLQLGLWSLACFLVSMGLICTFGRVKHFS